MNFVTAADDTVHAFPDDATPEEMQAAMNEGPAGAATGAPDPHAALRAALYGGAGAAAVGGAAIGLAKGAKALGSAGVGAAGKIAAKFAAKQVPGVGTAIDLYDAAKQIKGAGAPADATAPTATPSPGSAEARIIEARALAAEHNARYAAARANLAERKLAGPGAPTTPPDEPTPGAGAPASAPVEPGPATPTQGKVVGSIGPAATTADVSRHEVQYFSKSQGKYVPIEEMPDPHIRNAMNQLHAQIGPTNKATPVARKTLQALKDEATYRMQKGGELTVPGPVGKAQTAAAATFEDQALARATGAAQAQKAIALEQAMAQHGVPAGERPALRNGVAMAEAGELGPALKGVAHLGGPALELMLMVLQAKDMPQQMNQAHQILTPPAIRQATAGAPTPS